MRTPRRHIRDLGTVFTVSAPSGGPTDVSVIEGAVEEVPARPGQSARPLLIAAGHAVQITDDALLPLSFAASAMTLPGTMPPEMVPPLVHWSFDQNVGEVFICEGALSPAQIVRLMDTNKLE